jgi:hypothetical protein
MAAEVLFPRDLTPREKDLLLWLLPADRPGYREYRQLVSTWKVAGSGRRGEGNFILTAGTTRVDNDSPLPQIFAYGIVENAECIIAATIRERLDDQVEFEIVSLSGEGIPDELHETRRWTFSSWLPAHPCPNCHGGLRETEMKTGSGRRFVLAVCTRDERIWIYDETSGVNHPVPLTNFYNELMLQANIRDPNIALNSRRFFTDLRDYSDAALSRAFVSYNAQKTKIKLEDTLVIASEVKFSFLQRLRSRILKSN